MTKAVLETQEVIQAKKVVEKARAEANKLAQMENDLRQRLAQAEREASDALSADSADALLARQRNVTETRQALAHVLKARLAAELATARAEEQALQVEQRHIEQERQRLGEAEVKQFFSGLRSGQLPNPNATDAQLEEMAKRYREYLYRGREIAKLDARANAIMGASVLASSRLRILERDGQAELEHKLRELEHAGQIAPVQEQGGLANGDGD